ncbi:MAG TPA: nuclear transport factor 2 family protein [Ohtaekwangia sp.]|nr:nuclear transport factor 2 family protein [Ohtaekwangia sp.]
MVKIFLITLATVATNIGVQDYQKEINTQVWEPFIRTFNTFDTEGFMNVHSKDAIRSPRDGKIIFGRDHYYRQQKNGDARSRENGDKRTLELRFTERIANAREAIDVGIYKTTNITSNGERSSFFGRFHVVLRKENNTWKILVDTDSSEGGTITEEDFLAAAPME